jgi:hypothetical protein
MPGSRSHDRSTACLRIGLSGGGRTIPALTICLTAVTLTVATGRAESEKIPPFASANFGWQSNLEDWEDAPPGAVHGPIRNDPAYPFRTNLEGNRAGTGATKRITNTKDPVLKPWAAAQIQATNDEILKGVRDIPFTAQSRCYPGGVPGQLLWPFEPVYFIQTPEVVWMIWQRDHLVRRVDLTNKHSALVTVEDPDTFNAPLTMTRRWFKFEGPMLETVCAENNIDPFNQNLVPQPEATTPDF